MSTLKPASGAKYYIYRNLHTGGFSVRYKGRVVERSNCLVGNDVVFKVSESGRQRVLLEKRKNVHAYSVCENCVLAPSPSQRMIDMLKIITYNPYIAGHFLCNGKEITKADQILFYDGKCYLIC